MYRKICKILGQKYSFFGPKSIFFLKWSNFFITFVTLQPIGNIFVLTPLQAGPGACCRGPFFALNSAIFLPYTYETPISWLERTRLNRIISPPYPEVTLDNFSFPVGGPLASRRAVFRPPGQILAISGQSPIAIISTLNFGLWSTKLSGTIQAIKKMTHNGNGLVQAGITEKWPFLRLAEKCFFFAKNQFFPKKTPEIC